MTSSQPVVLPSPELQTVYVPPGATVAPDANCMPYSKTPDVEQPLAQDASEYPAPRLTVEEVGLYI